MADILYLEKSPFLTEQTILNFPDLSITHLFDETLFYKTLFVERPFLIIIGDTGAQKIVELLFSLKTVPGFQKIPVIFYGESEFLSVLPVQKCFSRNSDKTMDFVHDVKGLLIWSRQKIGEEKDKWPVPRDILSAEVQQRRSRELMTDNIFRKHLYSEIVGMNIMDLSLEKVIDKVLEKLSILLSAEVSFLYLVGGDNELTHLFLKQNSHKYNGDEIKKICLDSIKGKSNSNQSSLNLFIVLNESLSLDDSLKGYLLLGNIDNRSGLITKSISSSIVNNVREVLEMASRFYKKKDKTDVIFRAFTQFLPAPIINDLLLKQSEKALMTGEKRKIVVLFSHIRKFDQIVEENEPRKVVEFLNAHFSNMVRIIQSHGGSIDKFIGDAIFAIFGAPISYSDNTDRAAKAALEMIQSYKNIVLDDVHLPECGFLIGVGLNEGEAIIGNIGCADKFDYTAIGDTVNLAARLESLTKHYHQEILISRIVYEQIRKNYYCRLVDRARVKGKNEATDIYSLIVTPEKYSQRWKDIYSRGLKMYSLANWCTAAEYFTRALELIPDDFLSSLMLERCNEYILTPPETWDGAIFLDFK